MITLYKIEKGILICFILHGYGVQTIVTRDWVSYTSLQNK